MKLDDLKSDHQLRIEEFMHRAEAMAPGKQGVPKRPTIPDENVRCLRARLILEEAIETVQALGFSITLGINGPHFSSADSLWLCPNDDLCVDLAEVADGCADLSVVTIGTLSACGLPDNPILYEVDANNLAKFGPGSSVDRHGKLIKPPGHKPPDLKTLIESL